MRRRKALTMTPEEVRVARGDRTQEEAAEDWGAAVRTVQSWELGERKPPAMLTRLVEWEARRLTEVPAPP